MDCSLTSTPTLKTRPIANHSNKEKDNNLLNWLRTVWVIKTHKWTVEWSFVSVCSGNLRLDAHSYKQSVVSIQETSEILLSRATLALSSTVYIESKHNSSQ